MNYFQIIPEKIYNEIPTISELIRSEIKGFTEDRLREVISVVACHVRKEEKSAQIQTDYLKKLVPQGDRYLTKLIELGIIERSGFYVPGSASYSYSFAPEFFSKYLSVPLTDQKLIYHIELARKKLRRKTANHIRNHADQTKYLRKLSIDTEALRFIEENYTTNTHKYNCAEASATRIMNGDIFYSIDNTSFRFHSNVTNIDKELRQFLRVNGERVLNVDVKNSQPYLSTIILTNPSQVSWLTNNTAFAMLLQSLKVSMNEDVKKYIGLVVSGELYEFLMEKFSLARSETKSQVLRILFARNRMPKDETNRRCREAFISEFPVVHKIFSKVRGRERGDKFTSYKRFSILLQRIESYLMLDIILKRIYRELPGVVAITIHDSVMTGILTNDVEAVRKIMIEELTNFIGFAPKVKIEGIFEEKREEINSKLFSNQYDATIPASLN
jgi:hypothetical protein